MEIKGIITKILPIVNGTSKAGKEFVKQEFVVQEATDRYPQSICLTAFGEEKIQALANVQVGQAVTALFDVSCREYNGCFYNSINFYKFESVEQSTAPQAPQTTYVGYEQTQPAALQSTPQQTQMFAGDDDLPF